MIKSINNESINRIIWGDKVKLIKGITIEELYNLIKINNNVIYFPIYVMMRHSSTNSRKGKFSRMSIKPSKNNNEYDTIICKDKNDAFYSIERTYSKDTIIDCYIPKNIKIN